MIIKIDFVLNFTVKICFLGFFNSNFYLVPIAQQFENSHYFKSIDFSFTDVLIIELSFNYLSIKLKIMIMFIDLEELDHLDFQLKVRFFQ